MKIKWFGTASIEIESDDQKLLIDPFVPLSGSDVPIKIEEFDACTAILVTHGHFDHIASIPEICRRNPEVKIYCTTAPLETLRIKDVPFKNLVWIDYGKPLMIEGFHVTPYHGKHAVLPRLTFKRALSMIFSKHIKNLFYIIRESRNCREKDETVLYLIEAEGKKVLVMGSMNLRADQEYPEKCDALVLPYAGWDDNLSHAVKIIDKLEPKKVFLDHYDNTFPPVTSAIDTTKIQKKYIGTVVKMTYYKHEYI